MSAARIIALPRHFARNLRKDEQAHERLTGEAAAADELYVACCGRCKKMKPRRKPVPISSVTASWG